MTDDQDKNISQDSKTQNNQGAKTHKLSSWLAAILILLLAFVLFMATLFFFNAWKQQQRGTPQQNNHIAALQQSINNLQKDFSKRLQASQQMMQTQMQEQLQQKTALNNSDKKPFNQQETALQESINHQDILFLLSRAQLALKVEKNITKSLMILNLLQDLIKKNNNTQYSIVQQKLTKAINELRTIRNYNENTLYFQLMALGDKVAKLKFINITPKSTQNEKTKSSQPEHYHKMKAMTQKFFAGVWDGLKNIVVIQKGEVSKAPLLSPPQQQFLRENIRLQFSIAAWAALHHDNTIYQDSLARAEKWLKEFYCSSDEQVQNVLTIIRELKQKNIDPKLPSLAPLMDTLNNYKNTVSEENNKPIKKQRVPHSVDKVEGQSS